MSALKDMDSAMLRRLTSQFLEALAQKNDPHEVVMAMLTTYAETDMTASDLIKILSGAIILLSQAQDRVAHSGYLVTMNLLILLYPGKSLEEINEIARDCLMGEEQREFPAVRVVVIRRHEE